MTDTLSPHADNGRFSYILIPVSRQSYALVDFADADLADFTWSYSSGGYAVRNSGFSNPEEAARAYDRAAIEQHGSKAITNFPLSDYEGGK